MVDNLHPTDARDDIFDVKAVSKSLNAKTGRSASTVLIYSALRLCLTLGTTAILARLIPPEEFGVYAIVFPFLIIGAAFSEFGLAQAIVQKPDVTHLLATTLFWINAALGFTLAAGVASMAAFSQSIYGSEYVGQLFMALAPYVFISAICTQYVAILQRQLRNKAIENCNLLAMLLSVPLAVIAALYGLGAWALVVQLLANQTLLFVFLLLTVGWLPSPLWKAHFSSALSSVKFGSFLALERLTLQATNQLQLIIIGTFFAPAQAGFFLRAQNIANLPLKRVASPLSGVFVPSLSRLAQDPAGFRTMYERQLTRGNLIMLPIALTVVLASDAIVLVLLGPDWTGSIPFLSILGVWLVFALVSGSFNFALVASKKSKQLFQARLIALVLQALFLMMSVRFGIQTMIIVFIVTQVFVVLPIFAQIAVTHTALDWATLRRALKFDLPLAVATGMIGFAYRWSADQTILLEVLVVIAFIGLVFGTKVLLSPALRADVLKASGLRKTGDPG